MVNLILIGCIAVIFVIMLILSYVKAPPNTAYLISGLSKNPRVLIGKAGFKIPFFERIDKINLGAIKIDVKTKSSIPTEDFIGVNIDATANIEISHEPELLVIAARNYLNMPKENIVADVNELLEGNLREIIGTLPLVTITTDKKAFSAQVKENADPDLRKLGLNLINFNVQNVKDDNGVIDNLGIDNVEQIRKKATIAKSDAQREIAIAEAENAKSANDAKVKAAEEIAKRNNDLAIKQAELKQEADTKLAQAEAAKAIEAENQRKAQEVATANANLARQEKEIELKAREVEIKERALEAEIKKTAEAKKYAEQQEADARLYATQKAAEADLYERQRQAEAAKLEAEKKAEADLALAEADAAAKKALAEATKAQGEAEAAAAKAKGLAEAEAIKAKAEAEAEGLMKKAEAMKQYGDAAMADMQMNVIKAYFEQLPAIAAAVGEGYQGVDKIVMLGNDSSQLAGNIMNTTTQISEGLSQSIGVDLKSLLSGFLGGKIAIGSDEQ